MGDAGSDLDVDVDKEKNSSVPFLPAHAGDQKSRIVCIVPASQSR